jgi:hypothetical protein
MLSAGKLARHWLDNPTSSFPRSVSQCCSNASRCRLYALHAPQMYLSKVPIDSYQYSMRSISQLSNSESGRRSPGHGHGQIDGHIIGDLSQPIARPRRQQEISVVPFKVQNLVHTRAWLLPAIWDMMNGHGSIVRHAKSGVMSSVMRTNIISHKSNE